MQKHFILKIYNPIVAAVATYRSKSGVLKVGSSEECDLQVYLPSLKPIHIVVDFNEQTLRAIGNDVHCDTVHVIQGTSVQFSNDSIVRIHSILFMFLTLESMEDAEQYDERITSASIRYNEYSPVLRISHNDQTLKGNEEQLLRDKSGRNLREDSLNQNSGTLKDIYEKELGDFANMPCLSVSDESAKGSISTVAQKVIEKTEKEFEDTFKAKPTQDMIEAVIQRKIEENAQEASEILNGDINISITKTHAPDLGVLAIEQDILRQAETVLEHHSKSEDDSLVNNDRDKSIIEAELNTFDQLKNNITDNIKEEVREEIAQLIHDEAKDQVEKVIKECLPNLINQNMPNPELDFQNEKEENVSVSNIEKEDRETPEVPKKPTKSKKKDMNVSCTQREDESRPEIFKELTKPKNEKKKNKQASQSPKKVHNPAKSTISKSSVAKKGANVKATKSASKSKDSDDPPEENSKEAEKRRNENEQSGERKKRRAAVQSAQKMDSQKKK